jgi:formylglycine-generating enzyme required for sulfatase activity
MGMIVFILLVGCGGKQAEGPHEIPFPEPPYELGDTLTRPIDGSVMVYVPGGTFEMGSFPGDDQFGPHTVTLDGFWIDQTEVTNAQFVALMNIKGNVMEGGWTWIEVEVIEDAQIGPVKDKFEPDPGMEDHPVVEVTWPGARAYCEWVGGRLLTEAEWEYAARGPELYIYPWGNEEPTCELAQFAGCGDTSAPVGSLDAGASWVGAKDMAGNVWEWTADYKAEYPTEPQTNPTGPEAVEPTLDGEPWMEKVSRGGSFGSSPATLHTAFRKRAGGSQPNLGFRCAASSP